MSFPEIPPERHIMYDLRNPRVYDTNTEGAVRFANVYFQNTLYEWNLLDDGVKKTPDQYLSLSGSYC